MKTTKTVRITCCCNCFNLKHCCDVCRFSSSIGSLSDRVSPFPRPSSGLSGYCLLSDWKVVLVIYKGVNIDSQSASSNISLLSLLSKKFVNLSSRIYNVTLQCKTHQFSIATCSCGMGYDTGCGD
jgi:hypothetical protein